MTNESTQTAEAVETETTQTPEEVVEKKQVEEEADETESEEDESEDDSDETGEQEEPEIDPEEKAKELEQKVQSMQRAIDKKTAAYHAQQRAHEKALQELQELQQRLNQNAASKEPSVDDFETYEEYDKARTDWVKNEAKREAQQEFINQQHQIEQENIMKQRLARRHEQEAEYVKDNPHYTQSVQEVDAFITQAKIAPDVANAVLSQVYKGDVPKIIDYFGRNYGENLGELEKISQMSAPDAAIEVYKLQQKLATETPVKREEKPLPKPVSKQKGAGGVRKDVNRMSGEELLKHLKLA